MKVQLALRRMLNKQIALEADASNKYLAVASWAEHAGYDGATVFFYNQAEEERQHMLKIIHFMNKMGVRAEIPAASKPAASFKSLEAALKAGLKSEQAVSAAIAKMIEAAARSKNRHVFTFLQWFVTEQAEEEEKFEAMLQKFDLIGRDKLAVNEIDKILGAAPAGDAPDQA